MAAYPGIDSDIEEQAAFFYRFGFCVLPEVWKGERLEELRAAWRRRQRPAIEKRNASHYESTGLQRRQDSTFVDVPQEELFAGLVEQLEAGQHPEDAVLLDIIDPPRLVSLLTRLFVTDEWTELRMPGLLQARTYPARDDPGGDGRGYIGWHRDHDGPGLGVSVNPASVIKVFTYFEDVAENAGATTVVPCAAPLAGPADPQSSAHVRWLCVGSGARTC